MSYIQSNQESDCLAVNWRASEQLSNPNWLLIMCRRLHLQPLLGQYKPPINTHFSDAYNGNSWWRTSCTGGAARRRHGEKLGCTLTSLIAETAIAKPKQTMLPVLVILFLLSYGLMATLVVEQGRTIDSQRGLIHQLFEDSLKLSVMQGSAAQKAHTDAQAKAQSQAKIGQTSPQGWQAKPPDPAPQARTKSGHAAGKLKKPAPLRPPKATSDDTDERRALISI